MWDTPTATWAGEGSDRIQEYDTAPASQGRCDNQLVEDVELKQPTTHLEKKRGGITAKNREIWAL